MARGPGIDGEKRIDKPDRQPSPDDKRARVGQVLRRAYDEAVAEPIPDIFAELLRKLD